LAITFATAGCLIGPTTSGNFARGVRRRSALGGGTGFSRVGAVDEDPRAASASMTGAIHTLALYQC
jgi:hypothetical protein